MGRRSALLLTVFVELLLVAIVVRVSVRVALYFNRSASEGGEKGEGGWLGISRSVNYCKDRFLSNSNTYFSAVRSNLILRRTDIRVILNTSSPDLDFSKLPF